MVATRVRALFGAGWVDGMNTLASFFPVQVVSHLVGLPEVGRERMLEWAAATFSLIGPNSEAADVTLLGEHRVFMASLNAETVR